jgi:Flp pilus assembly protein TadD
MGITPWTYLLNQFEMITAYLRLAVWPHALVADYGMPRALQVRDVIPQIAFVLSLAVVAIVLVTRWPRVGFLGAAFFVTLAPTTSIVPIASEVGAERRMYVPLAALVVLLMLAARWGVRWIASRRGDRAAHIIGGGVAAAVVIALATRTMYRNDDYRTPLSLWQTSVERRPQGRARTMFASELIEAGRRDEGLRQLREATRDYPTAHFALGTELYAAGKFDEAIAELRPLTTTARKNPEFIPAEHLIGRALAAQGNVSGAAVEFARLLEQIPSDPDTHGLLADALFQQKRFDEVIPHYRTLLAAHPNIASAWENLAVSLASLGRLDEAIDGFQHVATLIPDYPGVQRNLAHAFLDRGDVRQAERHAREAIRLAPDDATAHGMLAIALASQNALDEAIQQFQRTLELNPADGSARDGLARALRLRKGPTTGQRPDPRN